MTKQELWEYTEEGHEIEWKYQDKWYSIVYGEDENKQIYFSVCEFYQEPVEVYTFDEMINIQFNGVTVMEMLETFPDNAKTDILRIF